MQSTGLAVPELNEAHGPGDIKSLISPPWAVQWSSLWCEVKTTWREGQEGDPVPVDSLLGLSPWASGQDPQCLGNVSFPPVKLIMALTADKHREMGAGDQQKRTAAPLALSPTTQSRPGAMLSKHSAPLQISFLKMVNPPLGDYIQNPALPDYWNLIFWSLAIFQELYTYYLNEPSWRLYQYWHYFPYSSFYRWCH